MGKPGRPDYEVELFCRCPPSHNRADHDKTGCKHPVTRFWFDRRKQVYILINMPCQCKVKGGCGN